MQTDLSIQFSPEVQKPRKGLENQDKVEKDYASINDTIDIHRLNKPTIPKELQDKKNRNQMNATHLDSINETSPHVKFVSQFFPQYLIIKGWKASKLARLTSD